MNEGVKWGKNKHKYGPKKGLEYNEVLKVSSPKGCSKLFLCEYQPEVMEINLSVVLIPLFGIDTPVSSEGIRLHTELSGT